ncbi:MAG: PD40 domain-containing protein [Bacteroidetes bacterium]|nr:PD40 domain-containing protein [Bacteroidota bacterium]
MKNSPVSFFLSALFIVPLVFPAFASDVSVEMKIKDRIKMTVARIRYSQRDYKAALRLYHDVLETNSLDPKVQLWLGLCELELGNPALALEYLQKALYMKSDVHKKIHLFIGMAYHRTGNLQKAVEEYNTYKATLSPSSVPKNEVSRYLDQCNYAQEMMKKPINVKISNLGPAINSEYPDYAPSVTLDEKTIIFTSRRADTKGKGRDNYDHGFYEDVYIANFNDTTKTWRQSTNIKGGINTNFHDASLSISPEGKQIFVYRNIPNKTRSGDIYVSILGSTGRWSSPQALPKSINSSYFESSACVSADGNTLYFISETKGGFGQGDIWKSEKTSKGQWDEPENLGNIINTAEDEIGVYIHPDGKTLFFSSKGHKSLGGYDIFRSVFQNDNWSVPENVGYPVNTTDDDVHFVMTADNKRGYFSSLRDGGKGEKDIYVIEIPQLSELLPSVKKEEASKYSILKGKITDSQTLQGVRGEIIVVNSEKKDTAGTTQSKEDGEYFIMLPAEKSYHVIFSSARYLPVSADITLPYDANITYALVKDFVAERKEKLVSVNPDLFKVKNILFKTAQVQLTISEESKVQLDAVIGQLLSTTTFKLLIHGHTDFVGKEKFNIELSLKRANFIADYARTKGVSDNRIMVKGFGSQFPIASNDTEEGRAQNRRVEVKLIED